VTRLSKVRFIVLLVMLALVAVYLARFGFFWNGGSDGHQFR
jgi:nitrogen fixation-related uncharacterized protein